MSDKPKILAFAGSSRKESFNKKLVKVAVRGAEKAGGEVTVIDLADYDLPIFNQDLENEKGIPEKGRELKKIFLEHQGLLISSPEYNSSISPLLKNTIDWVSRKEGDEGPLACYKGKVLGLMSASPGGLGGLRGLVHVRAIFQNIGVVVIPEQRAVSSAHEAFGDDGDLLDEATRDAVEAIGARVVEVVRGLITNP